MGRIFTRDEYRVLKVAGIPAGAITKYSLRKLIPHNARKQSIITLLGRDPWDGTKAREMNFKVNKSKDVKDVPADPVTEQERKSMPINAPALLSATLKRGIKDCLLPVCIDNNGRDANKSTRESALAWLRDKSHGGVTSFVGICTALGIDPDRVRKRVLAGKVCFDDKDAQ